MSCRCALRIERALQCLGCNQRRVRVALVPCGHCFCETCASEKQAHGCDCRQPTTGLSNPVAHVVELLTTQRDGRHDICDSCVHMLKSICQKLSPSGTQDELIPPTLREFLDRHHQQQGCCDADDCSSQFLPDNEPASAADNTNAGGSLEPPNDCQPL